MSNRKPRNRGSQSTTHANASRVPKLEKSSANKSLGNLKLGNDDKSLISRNRAASLNRGGGGEVRVVKSLPDAMDPVDKSSEMSNSDQPLEGANYDPLLDIKQQNVTTSSSDNLGARQDAFVPTEPDLASNLDHPGFIEPPRLPDVPAGKSTSTTTTEHNKKWIAQEVSLTFLVTFLLNFRSQGELGIFRGKSEKVWKTTISRTCLLTSISTWKIPKMTSSSRPKVTSSSNGSDRM